MSNSIPLRGFGTFQADSSVYPPGTAKKGVLTALKAGYRHIDTAYAYSSGEIEREVGEAIRESGIPREDLFVVTKLHNTFHAPEDVQVGIDFSLRNLGLDYVDLYLMHNPYAYAKGPDFSTLRRPDGSGKPVIDLELSRKYPETWKAMAALIPAGKTPLGVSNFNILKTKRLIEETGIVPTANQVEMNPYFPQFELLDFCKANGIQVIAHCPLGGALSPSVTNREGPGPLEDPVIKSIAIAHGKTAAQIILAWLTGWGICVVPKSADPMRIESNFDMLFPLSKEEGAQIANLVGPRGELGMRNLDNRHHIGFDIFDEHVDQPA
ncbi:Aldo/keto reductase [Zopfia rhizophila CBS 207.26]|uniref:Aldo/keto reductase n=1 Tax=Zopfia rhizophila CBS 207.26 TaxID=1314779 RepID=A0A6A6D864_9PEZI|nr:Aldo/keto reductase [Zopfia rhizophila CBS 207.26]